VRRLAVTAFAMGVRARQIEEKNCSASSLGDDGPDHSTPWEKRLAPFDRLEFAVSDAAKGIASAVARLAEARRTDPEAPTLVHGLDVFHTTIEARRVLAQHWRRGDRPRRLEPGGRGVRAGPAS
jgi:hypothetical protein